MSIARNIINKINEVERRKYKNAYDRDRESGDTGYDNHEKQIPVVKSGEDFKYGYLLPSSVVTRDEDIGIEIYETFEEAKMMWNLITISKTGKQLVCDFCGMKFKMRNPKQALDCHDSHLDEIKKIKVPLDYEFATIDEFYWVGKKVGGKLNYVRNYGFVLQHVFEQDHYGSVYKEGNNWVDFSEFDLDVDPAKFVDKSKYLKL